MDFYNYLSCLPRLFFHPFKTLSEVLETVRSEGNKKFAMSAFWMSLLGNTSLALSNMLSSRVRGVSLAGMLFEIIFYLILTYLSYFFSLAVFYFMLSLLNKKTDLTEFMGLFLSADFVYVLLLPAALIFSFVPYFFTILYGAIVLFIVIFNIILKIRAITLSSQISNFGSAVLYFSPFLFSLFAAILGIVYLIMNIFRLAAN